MGQFMGAQSGRIVAAAVLAAVFSGGQSLDALRSSYRTSSPDVVSVVSSSPPASVSEMRESIETDLTAGGVLAGYESLVRELFTLLESQAQLRSMRSIGIRIARFEDPEEDDVEAVVTQTVDASADEALAYWDAIGLGIQSWSARLPDNQAHVLLNRIAVNIDWSNGDAATVRPG